MPPRPAPPITTATQTSRTNPTLASTSTTDPGTSKRPRDARLIHMLLSSLGVTAYQDRVPLQLMDFAYRYTSTILQDALHLAAEGYTGIQPDGTVTYGGPAGRGAAANSDTGGVNLAAVRLSINSRLQYQFQPGLPKEALVELANERNNVRLPGSGGLGLPRAVGPELSGVRLPNERYLLSGRGWGLKEAWESEGEESVEDDEEERMGDAEEDGMEGLEVEGDESMEDAVGDPDAGAGEDVDGEGDDDDGDGEKDEDREMEG